MREHTVTAFDAELDIMRATVVEMGRLVEQALAEALAALSSGDRAAAEAVVAADAKIDALALAVDEEAIAVTVRRQPVAVDLREIFTAYRIAIDLERIGDLGKGIARHAIALPAPAADPASQQGLARLAERATAALATAIDAYRRNDPIAAEGVRSNDDATDRAYTEAFRALMAAARQPGAEPEAMVHLLSCAKNLERIGDHATNIAEAIVFRVSGIFPALDRPRAVEVP
ncbi:phosphate signaling complex protein PhoU [Prosthecomicrobium pneumaticum]|uniref:Phosphate-specific transport system accessory protein PhoU n=1 Tax=Prosthecomicrobium pneumaticum TaxID=81895 RepID=A0A7W9CSK1_9HYPH|nr:phosphate signaling complex protein PhoU [Prosthecomicrobium pneumaticum]MBB5751140.1 phosphate transport system protein [Prosthecomicrobium pneumaticum]